VLFGVENSFPSALVERINARNPSAFRLNLFKRARFISIKNRTTPSFSTASPRDSVLSRVSEKCRAERNRGHQQSLLVRGDDKFFNYALAARLGVAVSPTVLLPHKEYPTEPPRSRCATWNSHSIGTACLPPSASMVS